MQKELSIIIVNTRSADYLRKCIPTIYSGHISDSFEVIVVDNDSRDGVEELLKGDFPEVKLVQGGMNLGFTRGNNLGYVHSCGKYLLFLNPDTEIRGTAIQLMINSLRDSEKAAIAGARLLNSDGSLQTSCVMSFPTVVNQFLGSDFLLRNFPKSRLWGSSTLVMPERGSAKVDVVSGACLMMKRESFEKVGGWDINYFVFCEDVDLCYKARQTGSEVLYLDEAVVLHHGGGSTSKKGQSRFSDVLKHESILTFMRNYYGFPYPLLYRASTLVSALIRLAILKGVLFFGRHDGWDVEGSCNKWKHILSWSLGSEKWASHLNKPGVMTRAKWNYVRDLMDKTS